MFSPRNILLIFCALGALLVGCGDDADSDSGNSSSEVTVAEGPPMSKAEFVKEANKICLTEDNREERTLIDYKSETKLDEEDPQKFNAYVTHQDLVPEVEKQIKKISELVPPEADREVVEEFLTSSQEAVDIVAAKERVKTLFVADPSFEEPSQIARKYGIWRCSIR